MYLGQATKILVTAALVLGVGIAEAKFSPPITANQIQTMNHEQLGKFSSELARHWVGIRELALRLDNSNLEGIEAIHALKNYACIEENIENLFELIRMEGRRVEKGEQSDRVLEEALMTLAEIGSGKPSRLMDELKDLHKEVLTRADGMAIKEKVDGWFIAAETGFQDNPTAAINLTSLIAAAEKIVNGPLVKLARFEKFLNSRIKGQPEVVELLVHLELRSKLYGEVREFPEAIFLMGLPGTGKDTTAEAWVDALHGGIPGAHVTHLFKLPIMKAHHDLWKVTGSSTGYMGSDQFPAFLEFLVQHADGKYKIEAGEKGGKRVVLNPEYQGTTLPGYFSPDQGIVFGNEFHNWAKDIKDVFLKQALEKGYFSINNPNGGLTEIYVPIRFLLATNDGVNLVTAREANGQRYGKPLTYEQITQKWQRVHADKQLLKNNLQANGSPNDSTGTAGALGTSEELLNRIPLRNLILMRALSPQDLKDIAQKTLKSLATKLLVPSELFESIEMEWDSKVIDFAQEYDYNAEENARPIVARVRSTIEETITKLVKDEKFKIGQRLKLHFDVEPNPDRTQSLVITTGTGEKFHEVIAETLKDKPVAAISDERIDELAQFAEKTNAEVFGVEAVVERMGDRVLSIANELTSITIARPVNVLAAFGLTSTGKTELAKKTAKRVMGKEEDLVTLDFSSIQTLHDFKTRVLGIKDGRGNPIPSDFMKAYDRNNGVLVVAFDELANVKDPDLLKELYDFFREPEVTTFADGKPRKMGGVFAIVTGNAGQEIFSAIPGDIPQEVQMQAWQDIAVKLASDVNLQLATLEKFLPWPLIARIGKNNIFFVPPHTYKSLRQLAQLKLGITLKKIAVTEGRRGFNVGFGSPEEYAKFIDVVIEEGFTLRHQGASIDAFIRDDFESSMNALLLKNKVASGSNVVLQFKEMTDNSKADVPAWIIYNVFVEGRTEPLQLKMRRPYRDAPLERNTDSELLTAFHEAGHSLVREALFGDAYPPVRVSIIPGVGNIAGEWVYYAGVAKNAVAKKIRHTRASIIREIAVLTAGETAERLTSKGETHSTGKVNDMERASRLARDAVLRFGLSEKWGTDGVPSGEDIKVYISNLSEDRKRLLEAEVKRLVKEGRDLAQRTIELNYHDIFIPLGVKLGEVGDMDEAALKEFYKAHPVRSPDKAGVIAKTISRVKAVGRAIVNRPEQTLHPEIHDAIQKPKAMADINEIAQQKKLAQYAQVPAPSGMPILTNATYEALKAKAASSSFAMDCAGIILRGKK